EEPPRADLVAGAAAGLAILTKSFLIIVALPLLLVALLPREGSRRRSPWPLIGTLSLPLLLWLVLELARFGRLFGGYPGETFSYPLFTGLLRLTLLPNKGLLWYAPIVLLFPLGWKRLRGRDALLAWSLLASALAVLLTMSAWWAWDGQAG